MNNIDDMDALYTEMSDDPNDESQDAIANLQYNSSKY